MKCNFILFFSCSSCSGPEPDYDKITSGFQTFVSSTPFKFRYNDGVLPELEVAYETWGELNEDRSNAVMIHAGLSASSHAKSHIVSFILICLPEDC